MTRPNLRSVEFSHGSAIKLMHQLRKTHRDLHPVIGVSIFPEGNVGRVGKVPNWAILIDQHPLHVRMESSDNLLSIIRYKAGRLVGE